jgi:formylglycine-generating enzyme required for sulfatase activity
VTFAEWDVCAAAGGCGGYRPSDQGWGRGNRPVINVSWQDAQSYATWLSGQTKQRYRLLTEAEWEYAARAGTVTPFAIGAQIRPDQAQYDWTYSYAGSPTRASYDKKAATVGSFPANAFGLHDMHGNVREWVQDCYRDALSGQPPQGSAYEMSNCASRVLCGGSWNSGPRSLRSAYRNGDAPGSRINNAGFRVARTL